MITITNLYKSFNGEPVLQGVNLEIPAGKITFIIGRSGGGKSVLLKHIVGLLKPDKGRVVVDTVTVSTLSTMEMPTFTKKFGMLFQNAALFDSMNVYDNVAFPLREHTDFPESKIRQIIREKLELVGLPDVETKMPSELSGGMRKRVGLARAIVLTPKILIYDEPTTGLDPIMTDVIDKLILRMQQRLGITSIVISHDIKSTLEVADRVAMLHEGKIVAVGTPAEFQNHPDPIVHHFLEGRSE